MPDNTVRNQISEVSSADPFAGPQAGRLFSNSALHTDAWIAAAVVILLGLSALMVYSTTAIISQELYGDSLTYIRKHLLHMVVGLFALYVGYSVNPAFLRKVSPLLLLLATFLLILVLVPGVGKVAGGARRWIAAGPLRLQPGELAKLCVLLYFAGYIGRHRRELRNFISGALVPFFVTAALGLLLLLEPDFGSAAVIMLIVLCQLLVGGSRLSHLFFLGAGAAASLVFLIASSSYRMRRFTAFIDPFEAPDGSGYQLVQSLIAVGSGGMSGLGLGAGKQKLFYLPAAHTDFIFAVIAEELGLIGAIFVLSLFFVIALRGFHHARRLSADPYLSSLCIGLTLLIVLPAFLNISVVTGLLPTKGLVLPLVGYGGTAMVISLVTIGILLRLTKMEPQ